MSRPKLIVGLVFSLQIVGAWGDELRGQKDARQPSVLLIGDVHSRAVYGGVAKATKGRLQVVQSKHGHFDTGAALRGMDQLLQKKRWDVICFNFGLSDLMYKDPRTRSIRAMSKAAGGVQVSTPKVYKVNLERLIRRFRESGAKLVWTATMPLSPRSRSSVVSDASIVEFNAVAAAVMKGQGVPVVDTHKQITQMLSKVKKRGRDREHNQILKRDLSGPLVRRILDHLK